MGMRKYLIMLSSLITFYQRMSIIIMRIVGNQKLPVLFLFAENALLFGSGCRFSK